MVWRVSFDPVVLNIFWQTMAYNERKRFLNVRLCGGWFYGLNTKQLQSYKVSNHSIENTGMVGSLRMYTLWSKVSVHVVETVIRISLWHSSQLWKLIPGGPTLCLYDSSNSAWSLSTRCLNVSGGMAAHSSYRAVSRAVSDVGHWGLEWSRHSNSLHRCSVGFRSGLLAGQPISGTLLSTNHFLTDLALWQGALSCWYR
jgi:hypothetical protein